MLRILRIIGIIVFALLVGYSANSLKKMHDAGTLFEQYNSDRRAQFTLLSVSVLALGFLGFFELTRSRREAERRRYGDRHHRKKEVLSDDGLDTQNIYSAPKTIDSWEGRKTRTTRPGYSEGFNMTALWMGLLRVCSIILPTVYAGVVVYQMLYGNRGETEFTVLVSFFSFLAVFALLTAIGLMQRKIWGMAMGYILAICNLLIFPFGTVGGLFLLIGLVGATPLFMIKAHERRRSRSKSSRKVPVAAT